jgi:hypothetical protein
MEAIYSSETSVHTRSTKPHIPEYGILHSHRRENLKSYTELFNYGLAYRLTSPNSFQEHPGFEELSVEDFTLSVIVPIIF